VIVALDLERDREPVAEVDHACVFAGPLQDTFAGGGQPLQQRRRMLVAAVLGPKQREDGELEMIRLPAEQVADLLKLAVRQPKGAMKRLFRYRRQEIESSGLSRRRFASERRRWPKDRGNTAARAKPAQPLWRHRKRCLTRWPRQTLKDL